MGARNHALGIPEYNVIKEVMDNHGVDDWRTLQTVITQEQEQRALVDAIAHVLTHVFWKGSIPTRLCTQLDTHILCGINVHTRPTSVRI